MTFSYYGPTSSFHWSVERHMTMPKSIAVSGESLINSFLNFLSFFLFLIRMRAGVREIVCEIVRACDHDRP